MTCPICSKNAEERYRPFCSKRCADIDLGRWLGGHYSIPGEAAEPQDTADGWMNEDGSNEDGRLH